MNEKLAKIRAEIIVAARKVKRDPGLITLLAVSKRQSIVQIEDLCASGQQEFGENYLQEARLKIATCPAKVKWHFIGHVQSNKVKQVAELFDVVHTLDRRKMADLLEQRLVTLDKQITVYIQVNIGREPQKSGVMPEDLPQLVEYVVQLPHLKFAGLMAMPPFTSNPEESRPYFQEMRLLAGDLLRRKIVGCQEVGLSMGMSSDLQVAIEEGATIVRVGTALFGERSNG